MTSIVAQQPTAVATSSQDVNPYEWNQKLAARKALKSVIGKPSAFQGKAAQADPSVNAMLAEALALVQQLAPRYPVQNLSAADRNAMLAKALKSFSNDYNADKVTDSTLPTAQSFIPDSSPAQSSGQTAAAAGPAAKNVDRATHQAVFAKALQKFAKDYNTDTVSRAEHTQSEQFLGQESKAASFAKAPALSPQVARDIATNPAANPVLPPISGKVGSPAEVKRVADKVQGGISVQTVNSGFMGGSDAGLNLEMFFLKATALYKEKEGKDRILMQQLHNLEDKISVDSDKVGIEFQTYSNEIDRLDSNQAFLRALPGMAQAVPAQFAKGQSNANPLMSDSQFDLMNGLSNLQHRGPTQAILLQDMIHRMATGKGIPMLPKSVNGKDPDQDQMLTEGTFKAYQPTQPDANYKKAEFDPQHPPSAEELKKITLTELYPGADKEANGESKGEVKRNLLTEEEISHLSEPDQKAYRAARQELHTRNFQDLYFLPGLVRLEQGRLQSAATTCYAKAKELETSDPQRSAMIKTFGDAWKDKAEKFSDKRTHLEKLGQTEEAKKYDAYIGGYNEAMRFEEKIVGPNEDSHSDDRRQLDMMSQMREANKQRLGEARVTIANAANPDKTEKKEDKARTDNLTQVLLATHMREHGIGGMLAAYRDGGTHFNPFRTTQVARAFADNRLARYQSAGFQDEISVARFKEQTHLSAIQDKGLKEYLTAVTLRTKNVPPPPDLSKLSSADKNHRIAYNQAVTERHVAEAYAGAYVRDTSRLCKAMTDAYLGGEASKQAFNANLAQALKKGKAPQLDANGVHVKDRDFLEFDPEKSSSRSAEENVPSVEQLGKWLGNASRERVLKHIKGREDIVQERMHEYAQRVAQAKQSGSKATPEEIAALEKMHASLEAEHGTKNLFSDMRQTIRQADGSTGKNPLWEKQAVSGLAKGLRTTFRMRGEQSHPTVVSSPKDFDRAGAEVPSGKGTIDKDDDSAIDRGDDGDLWATKEHPDGVDNNNLEDVLARNDAKSEGIRAAHGDTVVKGLARSKGTYDDSHLQTLTKLTNNSQNIDFKDLATKPGDDLQNSAQGLSQMAQQVKGDMDGSLSSELQKIDALCRQLQKTATSIPHPS